MRKGDIVYQVKYTLSSKNINNGIIYLSGIVSRTLESCGKKQATFYDYGNDYVFHKSASVESIFPSIEEAIKELDSFILKSSNRPAREDGYKVIYERADRIFSDSNNEWFLYAGEWENRCC